MSSSREEAYYKLGHYRLQDCKNGTFEERLYRPNLDGFTFEERLYPPNWHGFYLA